MKFNAEIDIPDHLLQESNVRTRFAPSPTGFMHVGSLRTALYGWLFARQNGGSFILRIEDTDKKREIEGSIGHIMQSLKWLGIEWDEGIDVGGPYEPYLQSARKETHHEYATRLLAQGHAYPDPYTTEEVDEFRKKAEEEKRPFLFREHRPETIQEWDGKTAVRFKVPHIKRYEWHDLIMGELSAGEEALDDFIIIKGDGYPTYNFAHIIDDIEMDITHVMRGQEFIPSTPNYLALYEALNEVPPIFATLPPILGEAGTKKLGKRDGAKDILDYREEGYVPEAMMNFLALLGWHPSEKEGETEGVPGEILSKDDLLQEFTIERIQKSGARFDDEKLLFINREWMRKLSDEEYIARGELNKAIQNEEMLSTLIPLLKERAHTFEEAREILSGELSFIFTAPDPSPEGLVAKEPKGHMGSTKAHLEAFMSFLDAQKTVRHAPDVITAEEAKEAMMPYADTISKEQGGRGAALWPLRYALSGLERSPDPFTLISLLGIKESMLRIDTAITTLKERFDILS